MTELTNTQETPNADLPQDGSSNPDNIETVDFGFSQEANVSPDAAGLTPDQSVSNPSETDPGKLTRIEQDLARKDKALKALGINPDSTMLEQFEKGIITEEELLGSIARPVTQPVVQQEPVETPLDKMQAVLNKVKTSKDATLEDFETLTAATLEALQSNAQREQATEMQQVAQKCQEAVFNVFDSTEYPLKDANLKATEREIFMAATDAHVTRDAQRLENPTSMLNPQTYQFYANKQTETLGKLKQAYIEMGRKLEREGVPPAPAAEIITPAAPGAGSMPKPPKTKITVDNMAEARKNWLASQKRV
jgi:hypothetical protein